jgi:hypothetical protein
MTKPLELALALGLALTFIGQCVADDRATARALIEEAITACGGEQLAKARLVLRTGKGVMAPVGVEVPFTVETAMHAPDQVRTAIDVGLAGQKLHVVLVVDGERGWRSSGGAVVDLTPGEVEDQREAAYVYWLTTLVPLRDKAFELTPLAEARLDDKAVVGVKVAHKGRVDVQLYFDKQTHLLVKAQRHSREAGTAVARETRFSDYKEYDGLQMPARLLESVNGKKTTEWTITRYKFPAQLEDGTFRKP